MTALRTLVLVICTSLAVAACGDDPGGRAAGGDPAVRIVATTGQAADFVREVGGDRVEVTGLLAPNADPHDFEVRPDDVKALADAELVVRSGGELDEWLDGAIDSSGTDASVLTLADHVELIDDDPHWWQDPRNAIRAVAAFARRAGRRRPRRRGRLPAGRGRLHRPLGAARPRGRRLHRQGAGGRPDPRHHP